jgi:hypothetical protein
MQSAVVKKVDRIIKKYHAIFEALEAYDVGKYKRSMIVNTRKKSNN